MDISKRISDLRNRRGMTVNRLANQAGVSQSYLREIEMGKYGNPSIDVLEALCGALKISMSEFFDESNEHYKIEDSLMRELLLMEPEQRGKLREFLEIMRERRRSNG